MGINLWLDDTRDPAKHGYIGWTWVKTAQEAIHILSTGVVNKLSLDHDLTEKASLGLPDDEQTGYDVLMWMRWIDIWPPGGVSVHSVNPVGRRRMQAVIDAHYGV